MKYSLKAVATSFNDKENTLDCIMTAEVVDRHGEIVDIDTMSLDNFMLNPVVCQFHEYDTWAVGKVLTIVKTTDEQGRKIMLGTLKFAVEEYDVAKTAWALYRNRYMSAFSIGFRVGGVETDASTGTTRLINCELLEISCVAVPANQLALAKSKGIDVSPVVKTIPEAILTREISEQISLIKSVLLDKEAPKLAEAKTGVTLNIEAKHQKANELLNRAIRMLR
jgi:phage head maturation protease